MFSPARMGRIQIFLSRLTLPDIRYRYRHIQIPFYINNHVANVGNCVIL